MEFVSFAVQEAVGVVTIDRPPVNALSTEVALELQSVFEECRSPEIRALVITGRPHFAAGADIRGFKETLDSGATERTAWELQMAVTTLEGLAKPTIAAVHGYALGGGLELALGCDFRYLAEDALVGQPEVLLGLIPGAGGTQRLPRVVGYQRAKEMILTGRQVEPAEALAIGLADKVAPTDGVLGLAMGDAREWATKATAAIGAAKRAIDEGAALPVAEGIVVEREHYQTAFGSRDAREGVDAFVEKRPARFSGS
jgi:enoyl-CoA hydratase/carnithine racemase